MKKKALKYIVPSVLLSISATTIANRGWKETLLGMMGGQQQSSYPSANQYNLTQDQAREYLAQILASFQHALDMSSGSFGRMSRFFVNTIVEDSNTYTNTNVGRRYDKNALDQRINSTILLYIEKKAYEYAYNRTSNSIIARRVADSMRNNALAAMQKSSYIDAETIAPFVGRALRRAVRDYVNRLDAPNQTYNQPYNQPYTPTPKPTQPHYTSKECMVCYDRLKDNVNRIYLYPCGHDMCVSCARQWFSQTQKSCPKCRQTVDLELLNVAITSLYIK